MTVRVSDIPVEPFRERFLAMEASVPRGPGPMPKDAANTVAERLGWFTPDGYSDGPRVRRVLGLRPSYWNGRNGRRYPPELQGFVTPETALRLCEALGLDPVDVGL